VLRPLSILLVALALVAVTGCGGGDDSPEGAAAAETAAEETNAEETTSEATETDASADDTSSFAWASEDCRNLVLAYSGLSAAIGAASTGQDVSGDVEKFGDYADKVPEEIRDAVETLAEAYGAFVSELEEIGFAAGATPSADQLQAFQAASASLATEEVQAAGEDLSAWTTENCG
jgi:hypothetical protein